MRTLAMDVLYSEGVIVWDELRLPRRQKRTAKVNLNALINETKESSSVEKQMSRV